MTTSTRFTGAADVESGRAITPTPYNTTRLRSDTWNRARDAARRLRKPVTEPLRRALVQACETALESLAAVEIYFAFPGLRVVDYLKELLATERYPELAAACIRVVRMTTSGTYRRLDLSMIQPADLLDLLRRSDGAIDHVPTSSERPYFEVLVVDDDDHDQAETRSTFRQMRSKDDHFQYEVVVVHSFEDALLAVALNPDIQSCVLRFSFPFDSQHAHSSITHRLLTLIGTNRAKLAGAMPGERTAMLGEVLKALRPELDLFRVTNAPVESVVGGEFRRVYYQSEDVYDMHVSILRAVHDRFDTPFFGALRSYSERPTGMFHALPVSRARTIAKSHWIEDFGRFYGMRLFFAETSATTGGLDSLLQPTGSLKSAQKLAARAFGADRTFFVTNGTSTANKIVMQALCRPEDIVLLSHDCHKSHPYAVILSGATPVYLDAYALTDYSMYGGVSLVEIKHQLLALKRAGKLDRVRLLLLTNLTFDGITYNVYQVMKEILAIKPDIVFLWDEAWFAYGRFSPLLRNRTAMHAAARLENELRSDAYRAEFETWANGRAGPVGEDRLMEAGLMPDPDLAHVRVYATQSTHKTLTALRQGSMIHVHDVDFERSAQDPFHEAYMTHTSTSPNYQILASLDVGRRQVELEGYEFVTQSIEYALLLRERINSDPLLARYFRALTPQDMVPTEHRASGLEDFSDQEHSVDPIERAWRLDEFVLDPTRLTLHIGRTGMDGNTFKHLLMSEYDTHLNKTSRNTVLFLLHIGTTRGAIAHLVKVLTDIATKLDRRQHLASVAEQEAFDAKVKSLTESSPPLPNFSRFHSSFKLDPTSNTPEGDMRSAYFAAYDPALSTYVPLDAALRANVAGGSEMVSARFVTPYPPGFPVLVPGQVMTTEILDYLLALDVKEIHGFNPELGLQIFREQTLRDRAPARAPRGNGERASAQHAPLKGSA